jgi:hypothetical protein
MSSLLVLSLVLAAGPEDAKLEAAFSTYLAKLCEQRPATATALGEHAHDHRIDDLSAEGRKTREGLTRETLKVLNGLDEAKLSPASKVDLDIFRMSLRRELWASENLDVWANDPLLFNEFLSDSVYQIFASSTLPPQPQCPQRCRPHRTASDGYRRGQSQPEKSSESYCRNSNCSQQRRDRVLFHWHLRAFRRKTRQ